MRKALTQAPRIFRKETPEQWLHRVVGWPDASYVEDVRASEEMRAIETLKAETEKARSVLRKQRKEIRKQRRKRRRAKCRVAHQVGVERSVWTIGSRRMGDLRS